MCRLALEVSVRLREIRNTVCVVQSLLFLDSHAKEKLQSSDWISVDPWEGSQDGWTRTVQVLKHFRATLNSASSSYPTERSKITKALEESCGKGEEIRVKLLCGGDLLESFAVPGLWEDEDLKTILGEFGLVSSRAG